MKTFVSSFRSLLLVVAVLVTLVSVSQGAIVTTTMSLVGPSNTTQSWQSYAWHTLRLASAGLEPGPFPSAFPFSYTLAPNVLPWGAMTVFTDRSVWLGEEITDPTSPFYGQNGNMLYVPFTAKGDGINQINAQETSYNVTSTDGSLFASGVFSGLNYDGIYLIGGRYGPDGTMNGGVTYASAPGDTPVDWFTLLGASVSWNGTNLPIGYAPDYINSVGGSIGVTVSYNIDGYTSSQTHTVVPEPVTLAFLSFGLVLLKRRSKR